MTLRLEAIVRGTCAYGEDCFQLFVDLLMKPILFDELKSGPEGWVQPAVWLSLTVNRGPIEQRPLY